MGWQILVDWRGRGPVDTWIWREKHQVEVLRRVMRRTSLVTRLSTMMSSG